MRIRYTHLVTRKSGIGFESACRFRFAKETGIIALLRYYIQALPTADSGHGSNKGRRELLELDSYHIHSCLFRLSANSLVITHVVLSSLLS